MTNPKQTDEIAKLLFALMNPSARVIDAGETALENEQDSDYSSDADGNRHEYTYFPKGMGGAALEIFRSMIREWAEENKITLPDQVRRKAVVA